MEDAHIVADAKVWRRSNVFDVHCLDVYVVVAAAVVVVDALLGRDRHRHDTTNSGWAWI